MSIVKRYTLFIFGLFFVSLGISCAVKSMLGNAPISSAPYVLSLRYPLSLGGFTFFINMAFLLGQIAILGRKFKYVQLLQIPMTALFGCFIDFSMFLLSGVTPELYISKIITLLLGSTILALGVSLEIIGNVIVLPAEGIVNAIATRWRFSFGNTKTCFDISIVLVAGVLSWMYFGTFHGIREGTLVFAFFTGSIANFFISHLSYRSEGDGLIFQLPFSWFSGDEVKRQNS